MLYVDSSDENVCCPVPAQVANGSVSTPCGRGFGQEAFYVCDPGYVLMGDPSRSCRLDGAWSGTDPVCRRGNDNHNPHLPYEPLRPYQLDGSVCHLTGVWCTFPSSTGHIGFGLCVRPCICACVRACVIPSVQEPCMLGF